MYPDPWRFIAACHPVPAASNRVASGPCPTQARNVSNLRSLAAPRLCHCGEWLWPPGAVDCAAHEKAYINATCPVLHDMTVVTPRPSPIPFFVHRTRTPQQPLGGSHRGLGSSHITVGVYFDTSTTALFYHEGCSTRGPRTLAQTELCRPHHPRPWSYDSGIDSSTNCPHMRHPAALGSNRMASQELVG